MVSLCFALPSVVRLAEYALSAPDHTNYGEDQTLPALAWVQEDSIYLVSNGLPALAETEGGVVFAEGWEL